MPKLVLAGRLPAQQNAIVRKFYYDLVKGLSYTLEKPILRSHLEE